MSGRDCRASVDRDGRLIKRPYPWEREMTVCIAAIYYAGDKHQRIAVCTDGRVGSALGNHEHALKIRSLGKQWYALVSGSTSSIEALVREYRIAFATATDLTAKGIYSLTKAAPIARKRDLAEEYVQSRYAISYDDFLQYGRERFPPEIFSSDLVAIKKLELDAELILAGYPTDKQNVGVPYLYHCDCFGVVRERVDYAVVGEGELLAEAALLRRKQHDMESLHHTLYNIYEAKREAESVGSVGKKLWLGLLSPDKGIKIITSEYESQLEPFYSEYGPRRIPDDFKLEDPNEESD